VPDPLPLGRSVVVRPGQPAPPAWEECERRAVTAVDGGTAEELHRAWRERRPLVIELSPGLGLDDPSSPPPEAVTGLQPWEWPVELDLPAERLHHGVWANSVDGRDPGRLRWRWAEVARAAGAGAAGGAAAGDVLLGDGTPAVCDGGPLDAGLGALVGLPVLHRFALEHGSVRPLRAAPAPAGPLAPDQLAAVTEPLGGARVIAPAGSGKTRVLTERARLLIDGWDLPPPALALVAYNVRAAGEMRDRLAELPGLRIRTLNALGLRLCGRARTVEEIEVRRMLSDLVAMPRRAETDPAAPWLEALSRVRLGLAAPEDVEDEVGDVSDLDRVARAYRAELAARDAVDFDEQVVGAIERLLADPAFRARSQRYARVLLVDEFQDLTPAHLLLLRLLSGPAGCMFAVGDDDQTIYGYAGASPRWLVDFGRWFPGSAAHSLEVNYRCPPAVVTAAANLLTRNGLRVPKVIRPARDTPPAGPGGGLRVLEPDRPSTAGGATTGPSSRTADAVVDLLEQGAPARSLAVLSRVNASLVPVHVLLGHRGVPVDSAGDRRFLQRGGVRAALAWLEIATAPPGAVSGAALREAARRPKRGMSNSLLDLVARPRRADSLEGLATWLEGKGSARDAEKVDQLARDVAMVRRAAGGGTARVLRVVRSQVGGGGLDASASALDQWSHGAIAAHADDLEALTELAALEPDPERFPAWLAERLSRPTDPDGVTLASIHAVKGREWPHVVLHHVTDGLLPHRLSEDVEEERRVFHVGITRAGLSVTLVPGFPPSPFLRELERPGRPPEAHEAPLAPAARAGRAAGPGDRPPAGGGRAGGGKAAGGSGKGRPAARVTEVVAATAGTAFSAGGHEHEVVETGPAAAVCLLGGGPASTSVRYGTPVTVGGRAAVLGHPAADKAWERLRAWRSEKAKALGFPPYVVFDDATLRLVAALLPGDEAGLLAVHGIGPAKLEAYGEDVLAIVEEMRAGEG
jgi:DNA helicase-2/ATP-dependent DNA helicase PcrA